MLGSCLVCVGWQYPTALMGMPIAHGRLSVGYLYSKSCKWVILRTRRYPLPAHLHDGGVLGRGQVPRVPVPKGRQHLGQRRVEVALRHALSRVLFSIVGKQKTQREKAFELCRENQTRQHLRQREFLELELFPCRANRAYSTAGERMLSQFYKSL